MIQDAGRSPDGAGLSQAEPEVSALRASIPNAAAYSPFVSGDNYNNSAPGRLGNWMQTYRGAQFWPLDMRPEDVFIEDIAHALSMICRYGGHCERFYSVAEHSVLVSEIVPPEMALLGLMHDATEAYVGDVIRPLKPALAGYKKIEGDVWLAIADRFSLPIEMPGEIKIADNAVLLAEQLVLMKDAPAPWCVGGVPAQVQIEGLSPRTAEDAFLARFAELAAQAMSARQGQDRNGLDPKPASAVGNADAPKGQDHD